MVVSEKKDYATQLASTVSPNCRSKELPPIISLMSLLLSCVCVFVRVGGCEALRPRNTRSKSC